MKILSALFIFPMLLTAQTAPLGQPSSSTGKIEAPFDLGLETAKVLVYKTPSTGPLKMLEVTPPNHQASDSSPVILFFFGGSWIRGQPSQFARQAHYLASRGMVALCVDYRVESRQHTTPFECVADGKSAVRWVRSHAKELGIDPNRIAVAGGSAGGHVAVSTAVLTELEEPGTDRSVSCVPNAIILFNPVIDTSVEGFGNERLGVRWREISPLHHVQAGLPPTIIFHGTSDKTAPFLGVQKFAEASVAVGNNCRLVAFENAGHGFYVRKEPYYSEVLREADRFLASLGWVEGEPTLSEPTSPQENKYP